MTGWLGKEAAAAWPRDAWRLCGADQVNLAEKMTQFAQTQLSLAISGQQVCHALAVVADQGQLPGADRGPVLMLWTH